MTSSTLQNDAPEPFASTFGKDFLASIVVFLVALPLCLGIAIASGVPPAMGLISGIIGGILIGSLSGAPLQVSGPAAGLVSIVYEIIQTHGVESLGIIVLMAGLFQVAAGIFRLAPIFRAVSPAVVQGMLAGIGVIIMASQFHVMVDDKPQSHALENIMLIPQAIMKGVFPMEDTSHHIAALIGVMTIAIIMIWTLMPKKFQIVPAALVSVGIAVIVATVWNLPVNYVQIPDQMFSTLNIVNGNSLTLLGNQDIWIAALTIAFVATAETMLSTTALEQLHTGPRAQFDREILAQGVGNTLAGFFGALPITGVIVRSKANIEAGAKTRLSPIMHGIWIFALVLIFPHLLEMIPIASLAAVLVYTGYKLIQPQSILAFAKLGRGELGIFLATLIGVVATNLLEGVLIGFGLASMRLLYKLSKIMVMTEQDDENHRMDVYLEGSATFLSLPTLSKCLEKVPPGWEAHIHIDRLYYIDHACLEVLRNFEKQYQSKGGDCVIEWDRISGGKKLRSEARPLVECSK